MDLNDSLNDSLQGEVHVYDQDGLRSVHNHEFMGIPLSVRRTSGGPRHRPGLPMALARSRRPLGGNMR
jgi:hypothetical protein